MTVPAKISAKKYSFIFGKMVFGQSRGLTLIELAVVVMVLGMLIYILTSNITGTTIGLKSNTLKIKLGMDKTWLYSRLEAYKSYFGVYPEEGRGLRVLAETDAGATGGWEPMNENKDALKDPWMREYRYRLESGKPVIYTLGTDGLEGGDGENRDIRLDELR